MKGKNHAINRRARFDYAILEKIEAGLQLLGTEVKSVKAGHMSIKGAFVTIHDNEAYLTNATIPAWQPQNSPSTYDPTRSRKLLIHKKELNHLISAKQSQGLTIVPIRVYTKRGTVKLEIALARGKKKHDKRESKKEADIQRDVDRIIRGKEY